MPIVSTSSLQGLALDWAIAQALQLPIVFDPMGFKKDAPNSAQAGYWIWEDEYKQGRRMLIGGDFSPSSHWGQGGEILEQAQMCLVPPCSELDEWSASLNDGAYRQKGATVLIASMRCFVMSHFGEQLEIPDALTSNLTTKDHQTQEQNNV